MFKPSTSFVRHMARKAKTIQEFNLPKTPKKNVKVGRYVFT